MGFTPPTLKAKVVLEAVKEDRASTELVSEYGVYPAQIRRWRKIAKDGIEVLVVKDLRISKTLILENGETIIFEERP